MIRLCALLLLLPSLAAAQGLDLAGSPPPPSPSAPQPAGQACMSVTAGNAVALSCINAEQRALVQQHQATVAATTPSQNSAPQSLGLFNQAATREHLGSNFGHSVIPQRPPPPNYGNPLIPR
jgi:hypothetical protein